MKANEFIEYEWEDYQNGTRGGFMKALAHAFDLADLKNLTKLVDAFPELYPLYAEFHGDVLHRNEAKTDESTSEEDILESFRAATEDVRYWAVRWCDMELLRSYADYAGKPFNADTETIVTVLKNNGINIGPISMKDVDEYIEDHKDDLNEEDKEGLKDLAESEYIVYMHDSIDMQDVLNDIVNEVL